MTPRNPLLASALSVVMPGLGQYYNGERAKGIAMLCITVGIGVSCVVFRSLTTCVLMGLVYLAVLIPAAVDAYQVAHGVPSPFRSDRAWYVIGMLLVVGPFALPLLWQSPRFSRTAKLGWTIGVVLVAVLCIVTVATLGPLLDQFLHQPTPSFQ